MIRELKARLEKSNVIQDLGAKLEKTSKQKLATEALKLAMGGAVAFTGTAALGGAAHAQGGVWEPAVGQSGNYTVLPGDTLSGIASHYRESLQQLESANPKITNPNQIYADEVIFIPAPGGGAVRQVAAAPAASSGRYKVVSGDTLTKIAREFGVSVSAIARANGIKNPNRISVGQELIIPGRGGGTVSSGAKAPAAPGGRYKVVSGDTLTKIAREFGVSVNALAQANGIRNPNLIYVGQDLVIPGHGRTASGGPPAPPVTGNVGTWIAEANAIQSARGVPGRCLDPSAVDIIIQHESGGNPNAINLWDSNARAGHPSEGLMQTIMPTFLAYATPGYAQSPYNPVDDIMAGENYACSRYGSVDNVPGVVAVREGRPYIGY